MTRAGREISSIATHSPAPAAACEGNLEITRNRPQLSLWSLKIKHPVPSPHHRSLSWDSYRSGKPGFCLSISSLINLTLLAWCWSGCPQSQAATIGGGGGADQLLPF